MKNLTLIFIMVFAASLASAQITFGYSMPSDSRTSAGVFDSTGVLIRTLWSGNHQRAGSYSYIWDGKTDAGAAPTTGNGTYTVKVLRNNVTYTWDGVIGSTESAWTDTTTNFDTEGYIPINNGKLTFVGGTAWFVPGYSEGQFNLKSFPVASPNSWNPPPNLAYLNQNDQFADVANDGKFLYIMSIKGYGPNAITKFGADGNPAAFTNGTVITTAAGGAFTSSTRAIIPLSEIAIATTAPPTGIAVQTVGNLLAVAYSSTNQIQFFDKTSGAALGTVITTRPSQIGFTSAGLWVLNSVYSSATVSLIASPNLANTITTPLAGLQNPVSLSTNKTNNHVFILDGGSSQQAKEFNDSTHTLVRSYGTAGGYTDWDPTITNDRLMVDEYATKGTLTSTHSWMRVDNQNGLWILDGGNGARLLHINAANRYVNQIQGGNNNYALGGSLSDPTKIFRYNLEYDIDYTRPLLPGDPDPANGGNGAWKLAKNWAVGAEGANASPSNTFDMITPGGYIDWVEKYPNGLTYATVRVRGSNTREFLMPASGKSPMVFMDTPVPYGTCESLQSDGSVMYVQTPTSTTNTFQRSTLTGFSGNVPQRSAFAKYGSVTYDPNVSPKLQCGGWGGPSRYMPSPNGTIPVWSPSPHVTTGATPGFFHIAGIVPGNSSYTYLIQPEANLSVPDFKGTFPGTSGYGGHAGANLQVLGSNIFEGFDGQYAPFGSTFYQFNQDGLFVGQYGFLPKVGTKGASFIAAMSAGNIARTQWVSYGGDIYMYLCLESGLAPMQRWRLTNLASIYEASGSGTPGQSITLH